MALQIRSMDSQDVSNTTNPQSFSRKLLTRYSEYTRVQELKLKIGSWNTATRLGTERDVATWFVRTNLPPRIHTPEADCEKLSDEERIAEALLEDGGGILEKNCTEDQYDISGHEQDEIGIYVLGLQEVVGLNTAKDYIGRIYNDTEPISRWRKALLEALPLDYVQIVEKQLFGMLLFIYASPSIAPRISSVSTVTIGTGIMGYLGNKGAIVTRIVLAETTRLVFVNSHLTSGADPQNLERRCWEVGQIIQKTVFEPINLTGFVTGAQDRIGDEDFAFWFGDLNFRLDLPGDEIRRLLALSIKGDYAVDLDPKHTAEDEVGEDETFVINIESDDDDEEHEDRTRPSMMNEVINREDSSSLIFQESDKLDLDLMSQNPASLQSTLNCLLPHDQLNNLQMKKKLFHDGWREGPITFLPTYKYDIGIEGFFDTSEKKRAPSWCDRILFRSRHDKTEFEENCKKNEALAGEENDKNTSKALNDAGNDQDLSLYNYNPDIDGSVNKSDPNLHDAEMKNPSQRLEEKRIEQNMYTSHQEIFSSDHKPIHANFTVSYDIILPELRAKIQQQVAKELDQAENEGRPGVTVVVDHSLDNPSKKYSESEKATDIVDFGEVAFSQRIFRYLTVANTSRVSATVKFVEKQSVSPEDDHNTLQWLLVHFVGSESDEDGSTSTWTKSDVTLDPGDAINVVLELFIQDIDLVRALNERTLYLEEIVVLRVTNGRDHFIPVHGTWLQTCIGCSIDQLVRVPEAGIRSLSWQDINSISASPGQDANCSAPLQLYWLTDTIQLLSERVIADSNILENANIPQDAPGWPFDPKSWLFTNLQKREVQKQLVIEALDTGQDMNNVFSPETLAIEKLEIVSEVLMIFISHLSDGIITHDLWLSLENAYANRGNSLEETKTWTLDILSAAPSHNISFVFLTSMLAHLASELASANNISRLDSCSSQKSKLMAKRSGSVAAIDSVLRQSITWKTKLSSSSPTLVPLPSLLDTRLNKRDSFVNQITNLFIPIIFQEVSGLKDREKKAIVEKRKVILLSFLSDF